MDAKQPGRRPDAGRVPLSQKGAEHREESQVTGDRRVTCRTLKSQEGPELSQKALSSQERAQTTRRTRNGQNGTEQICQGAGLPRESQATKGTENSKGVLVARRDKSDRKGANQPGRLDGPDAERPGGR